MKYLSSCKLYGILDLSYVDEDKVESVVQEMLISGIDVLQVRAKNYDIKKLTEIAHKCQILTRLGNIPLIVNDHPNIAKIICAQGVHIGQDDMPVDEARKILGEKSIIGKSTHSIEQVQKALSEDVDYIAYGPLFATNTKPDYKPVGLSDIQRVHQLVNGRVPVFCIGGITTDNLDEVCIAGAIRVVIVSGILQADSPALYIKNVKKVLHDNI